MHPSDESSTQRSGRWRGQSQTTRAISLLIQPSLFRPLATNFFSRFLPSIYFHSFNFSPPCAELMTSITARFKPCSGMSRFLLGFCLAIVGFLSGHDDVDAVDYHLGFRNWKEPTFGFRRHWILKPDPKYIPSHAQQNVRVVWGDSKSRKKLISKYLLNSPNPRSKDFRDCCLDAQNWNNVETQLSYGPSHLAFLIHLQAWSWKNEQMKHQKSKLGDNQKYCKEMGIWQRKLKVVISLRPLGTWYKIMCINIGYKYRCMPVTESQSGFTI